MKINLENSNSQGFGSTAVSTTTSTESKTPDNPSSITWYDFGMYPDATCRYDYTPQILNCDSDCFFEIVYNVGKRGKTLLLSLLECLLGKSLEFIKSLVVLFMAITLQKRHLKQEAGDHFL